MIAHVRISHARRNAYRACRRSEQGRFWDAEPTFGTQAIAGPEVLLFFAAVVRIVENFVSHRVVQCYRARDIIARTCRRLFCKLTYVRVVTINELPLGKVSLNAHGHHPYCGLE